MTKIFISYSRVDDEFTHLLASRLRRIYGHDNVWFDDDLHGQGGSNWWELILDAVEQADIFLYLLSNESVQSSYCQAEFTEAQRLNKHIITVQVRDRTKIPPELGHIQYINMEKGVDDAEAYNYLIASLTNIMRQTVNKEPKWEGRTLKPEFVTDLTKTLRDDVSTPMLELALPPKTKAKRSNFRVIIASFGLLILIIIIGFLGFWFNNRPLDSEVLEARTVIAQATHEAEAETEAFFATNTSIVRTENAELTQIARTATAMATQTAFSLATQVTWTPTATNTLRPSRTPTATIEPNIELIFEDFQDRDFQSRTVTSGFGQIVDAGEGNYVYRMVNNSNSEWSTFARFGNSSWENYSLEFRYRILSLSELSRANFNLRFRGGYLVGIESNYQTLCLSDNWADDECILTPQEADVWYWIRLEVQGSEIRVSLDNNLSLNLTNARIEGSDLEFFLAPKTQVQIDDITVISLAAN